MMNLGVLVWGLNRRLIEEIIYITNELETTIKFKHGS